MSKQTKPITKLCQSRKQCSRDAIWGVYTWAGSETDVNLDKPVRVYCGQHKPKLGHGQLARNVRIRRI